VCSQSPPHTQTHTHTPRTIKALCERGREESHGWKPTRFSTGNKLFPKDTSPYEGMYCAYDQQRDSADDIPYLKFGDGAPPQAFDNVMRIKLISSIIEAPVANQGCGLKLKDLTSYRACLACFPLHDHLALTFLQQKWMRICTLPHRQPEDDIKNYFGEKIGLYFVWLGHYTKWLMTASLVGLGAWTSIAALGNNPDSPAIPYFTVFMCVWTTLYLESWKRAEKRTALRWGMIDFEQEQQSRPEFEAIAFFRESPVTGLQEKYFPPEKRNPVLLYSNFVSSSYIVTVAAGIIAIYWFKAWLSSPLPFGKVYLGKGPTDDDEGGANNGTFALGGIIGSAMNAVQIQVMNTIYEAVALRLTNAENHRTETQFEDALISKTFSFQFVNSFMALIYLAFIKTPLAAAGQEQRCFPNCFQELNTSLGIIFISNIVSGNLGEILPPILAARAKAAAESKGSILADAGVKLTDVEKQFIAEEYDVLMGTFKDYGEMVIQYGYCTLFVAAFPLAPLLALVNNWIELRVDGWKLVQMHRRPFAVGAEDIGTWFSFLEIMSTLAVISNVALFVFTGSQLKDWGWLYRVIFFIVLEHILLTVKFMIAFAIPDVPEDVENAQAREDYLLSKVRDNVADEEEEEEYDTVEMVDLSVKLTDLVPAMDAQAVKSAMV